MGKILRGVRLDQELDDKITAYQGTHKLEDRTEAIVQLLTLALEGKDVKQVERAKTREPVEISKDGHYIKCQGTYKGQWVTEAHCKGCKDTECEIQSLKSIHMDSYSYVKKEKEKDGTYG